MSKLIGILGAPSSGKSTLATKVHYKLKQKGHNSIYVTEAATDYIAEYGFPTSPAEELVIYYNQLNREQMYMGKKDYIICDSSTILCYIYMRMLYKDKLTPKDISTINHLQKEILKSLNNWDKIYYVNPIETKLNDGIRHTQEMSEVYALDVKIKSYLDIENIAYTDLSDIELDDRSDIILKEIAGV